jgi:hypothetical protein
MRLLKPHPWAVGMACHPHGQWGWLATPMGHGGGQSTPFFYYFFFFYFILFLKK